ncbi:MAG TPA: DUF6624 domain-containing protein [Herpetosiphonaceae bacterium]
MNEQLRAELLQMQAEDLATRRELIEAGELYGPHLPKDWYHPRMAAVHRKNNARMSEILEQYGWPGEGLVGAEGGQAAWRIVQHAILDHDLQQRALPLLEAAVKAGEAPAQQWAMLTDRVLMESGQPQIYGSIFVGDEHGGIVPWTLADPDTVDARRASVGLAPLSDHADSLRRRVGVEQAVQQTAQAKTHKSAPEP